MGRRRAPPRRSLPWRLVRGLGVTGIWLLLGVSVALGGALLWGQSAQGKRVIAQQLTALAGDAGVTLHGLEISGPLLRAVRVERVAWPATDPAIVVHDLTFGWALEEGFSRLSLTEITAASVLIDPTRFPAAAAPRPDNEPSETTGATLQSLPLAVALRKIDLGRIDVVGTDAPLSLRASASANAALTQVVAQLSLQPPAGLPAADRITLDARVDLPAGEGALTLTLRAPDKGAIQRVAALSDLGDVALSIQGQGTLADGGQALIRATSDHYGTLGLPLQVRRDDQGGWTGELGLDLTTSLADLGRVQLASRGRFTAGETLILDDLRLEQEWLSVSAHGRYTPGSQIFQFGLQARPKVAGARAAAGPAPTAHGLVLDLEAEGTPDRVATRFTARAQAMHMAGIMVEGLDIALRGALDRQADAARLHLERAQVDRLSLPGPLSLQDLSLKGSAEASPAAGSLQDATLSLSLGRLALGDSVQVEQVQTRLTARGQTTDLQGSLGVEALQVGRLSLGPEGPVLAGFGLTARATLPPLTSGEDAALALRWGLRTATIGPSLEATDIAGQMGLTAPAEALHDLVQGQEPDALPLRLTRTGVTAGTLRAGQEIQVSDARLTVEAEGDALRQTATVERLGLAAQGVTLSDGTRLSQPQMALSVTLDGPAQRMSGLTLSAALPAADAPTGALVRDVRLGLEASPLSAGSPIPEAVSLRLSAADSGAGLAPHLSAQITTPSGAPGQRQLALALAPNIRSGGGLPAWLARALGERVQVAATLDLESQSLTDLGLQTAAATAQAERLTLAAPHVAAPVQITIADLSRLPGGVSGGLTLGASLTPQGQVALTARGTDLAAAGFRFGDARLSGTLDPAQPGGTLVLDTGFQGLPVRAEITAAAPRDGPIQVSPLILRTTGLSTRADLSIDPASSLANGTLSADIGDLSAVGQALGVPLAGGGGTLRMALIPQDGKQNAQVQATLGPTGFDSFRVQGLSLNAALADITGTPGTQADLSITGLTGPDLAVETLTLQARGTLEGGADIALTTQASLPVPLDLTATGVVSPTAVTLSRLEGRVMDQPLTLARGPLEARFGEALSLSVPSLRFADATLSAQATLGPQQQLAATLDLAAPLSLARMAAPDLDLSGRARLTATLQGSTTAPSGTVQLAVEEAQIAQRAALNLAPLALQSTINSDGRRVSLDTRLNTTDNAQRLALRGQVPLALALGGSPTGEIQADLAGTLSLETLAPFLAEMGHLVGGRVEVEGRVRGSANDPRFDIALRPQGMRYQNLAFGTDLTLTQGNIALTPEAVVIEGLIAQTPDNGMLSLTGQYGPVLTPGEPALDLDLSLNAAKLASSELVTATASGDVAVKGPFSALVISGAVTLDRADITIPSGAGAASFPGLEIEEDTPGQADPVRAAPPVAGTLDVRLSVPDRLFVRGCGADLQIGGDVAARGTLDRPVLAGELAIREGTLDLLSNTWSFSRGTATVRGVKGEDTQLDILATTPTKGDVTAQVGITGPPLDPDITFGSIPALPEDQVIARVLFGKDPSELSPVELASLAQSAASAATCGASTTDSVRETLGLDRLRVNTGDEITDVGVGAGRYVAEGVYLGVNQGLDADSTAVEVEVDITEELKLRSTVGARATGRVGLSFEYDW